MTESVRILVHVGGEVNEVSLPAGSTVEDLLRSNRMHPDAYIVTKGSKPVPITKQLEDGEALKLIKVASGG